MKSKKTLVCYNAKGVKLGFIVLNSNSDDLRVIFMDNKSEIKKKFPGTAFVKHKSPPNRASELNINTKKN